MAQEGRSAGGFRDIPCFFLLRIIPRGRGSHKSERGSGGPTVEKGTWESRWNSVGWLGSLLPVQLSLQYTYIDVSR